VCATFVRFRGGLVFKADRLVYHSTLGLRVIKQRREGQGRYVVVEAHADEVPRRDLFRHTGSGRFRAKRNSLKGFKDVYLKVKVRIWP